MPKSLNDLFNAPDSRLRSILSKASVLQSLTQRLHEMIDEPLAKHLYVANVRDQSLIIGADSAVWITRARYLAPMLLKQFKQDTGLIQLTRIEFKVQPFMADIKPIKFNRLQLSQRAGESIREGAEHTSDPYLRRALTRLSLKK